jgi:imidazolonepropionase-like amidohydrolase
LLALGAQGLFDGVAVTRGRVMVLVEGGRIVTVDRSGAAPPPYAEVVELTDATLLPGLVDAHVHLAFDPMGHPLVDVLGVDDDVLLSRMRSNAARALAAGITTMRDLGDARYLTGRLRSAWTGGPELLMSGPPITRTGGHCWFLGGEADGVDGVRAAVAQRVAAGVDVIKIMATGGLMTPGFGVHESQYGPAELRAACEAAHDCGLAITAHAHGPRGIAESVAAGVDGVEHATFLTPDGVEFDASTVDRLAAAGVFVGSTEAWLPGGPSLPPADARRLEQCRANVVRMQRAGVRVVCSSDAGVGSRKPPDVLPHGVVLFASLGFSTVDALAAATSVAARACGVGSRKGRLAPGFDADILAVAGDPTTDVRALLDVRAVFRAGRRVSRMADPRVEPPGRVAPPDTR